MLLYLARHGMAASTSPEQPSQLTDSGRAQTQLMAASLAKAHPQLTEIWHSPKVRAKQTAEIYRVALGIPPDRFIEKEELAIDGDVDALYAEIFAHKEKNLLLVSHQPLLEELSSLLVAGSDHLPAIAFPPSGLTLFEYNHSWKWISSTEPSQLK